MTSTDQHIAVMLYLNLVQQFAPPCHMADLYRIYWDNKIQIDSIVGNPALLGPIIVQFGPETGNVIVVDKQEMFAP
jgi:hypothetical protein